MTQNVCIGEYTDGEDRIAYAVQAESDAAVIEWLIHESLADAIYPADVVHRSEAVAWLRKRAQQGQGVAGNIPEADEIEQERLDESWDRFYAALRNDPKQLREWIEFQRSLRHVRDRMFVVRCLLSGGAPVAAVVIGRTKGQAISEATEAVRLWCNNAEIAAVDVDYAGRLQSGQTDEKAMRILRDCKSKGYELLGHLSVIGGHELDDPAVEDKSVREPNIGRSAP